MKAPIHSDIDTAAGILRARSQTMASCMSDNARGRLDREYSSQDCTGELTCHAFRSRKAAILLRAVCSQSLQQPWISGLPPLKNPHKMGLEQALS